MSNPVTPSKGSRRRIWLRRAGIGGGALMVLCAGVLIGPMRCWSAWLKWGVQLQTCPAAPPLATLDADLYNVGRAQHGILSVRGVATYTQGPSDEALVTELPLQSASAMLLQADGEEHSLELDKDGWSNVAGTLTAYAKLPSDLPDGDHTLRIAASSRMGDHSLEVALPVYAPAKVHLLTDRPLYEPGHIISMRSVVLRASDLVPLGGRPGRFTVTDPQGRPLLDERIPASDWGVAATTFPLDTDAEHGTWRACWMSHSAEGCSDFEVTEFTLPRFTVSARGSTSWSGRGDTPHIDGTVRLASGAPVRDAEITIQWRVDGDWTMPHSWLKEELPTYARSDAAGRFQLELPTVPEDLVGQATLIGTIKAVDPSGDRQTTQVRHLLSVDDIAVTAVSELGKDSLVEGMNNRLWVRATTASGSPLPGATVRVMRAWDPTAPALEALADEDGVAALQIDPGAPVNVVVSEPPTRTPPPPPPISLSDSWNLGTNRSASLADQRGFEAAMDTLATCADLISVKDGPQNAIEVIAVVEDSRVGEAHGSGILAQCLAARLRSQPMPSGPTRVLRARVRLQPAPLPSLQHTATDWVGTSPRFDASLRYALASARRCMPGLRRAQSLPLSLQWTTRPRTTRPTTRWLTTGAPIDELDSACFRNAMSDLQFDEAADATATGMLSFRATPAPAQSTGEPIPQERVVLGYELRVEAITGDGESLGQTKLVLPPGTVPDLRLRADPVLPKPGGQVKLTFLRGPSFQGVLPDELDLQHASGALLKGTLDKTTRTITYTLPDIPNTATRSGWWSASWAGALARVYVAPPGRLEVELAADGTVYRPGDNARIQITTHGSEGPVSAAVSLVGVDRTLQELAPLPGPGAMEGLQADVPTPSPAFGSLDGVALVRGRITGENARTAVLLRVGAPPAPEAIDAPVSASSSARPDPRTVLVDHFFPLLAELLREERAWEKQADETAKLDPAQTAKLWALARDAVSSRDGKEAVYDAYGRPIQLHQLPMELLDMTAPHNIAANGTRLPQDLENWPQWVAREEPK